MAFSMPTADALGVITNMVLYMHWGTKIMNINNNPRTYFHDYFVLSFQARVGKSNAYV